MKARELGAQSWSEARKVKDQQEAERDFRAWLPFVIGVWAGVLILLTKGF